MQFFRSISRKTGGNVARCWRSVALVLACCALLLPSLATAQGSFTLFDTVRAYEATGDNNLRPRELAVGTELEVLWSDPGSPFAKVRLKSAPLASRVFWLDPMSSVSQKWLWQFSEAQRNLKWIFADAMNQCSDPLDNLSPYRLPNRPPAVPKSESPAVRGARRVFATLYQDCEVVGRVIRANEEVPDVVLRDPQVRTPVGDYSTRLLTDEVRQDYIQANPMLRFLEEKKSLGLYPGPGCENALERPPIYSYGAKPVGSPREFSPLADLVQVQEGADRAGRLGVSPNSIPVTGMDCSGFVDAAFRAAGLNLTTPSNPKELGTRVIADIPRKEEASCLKHAPLHPKSGDGLQAGDIINLAGNHVVMVDSVGPDPFGIKRVENCDELGVEHFDFTYIHSGSVASLGVSRVEAAYHARPWTQAAWMNSLLHVARQYCDKAKSGVTGPVLTTGVSNGDFSIQRHVGAEKKGCVGIPGKMNGGECVGKCRL